MTLFRVPNAVPLWVESHSRSHRIMCMHDSVYVFIRMYVPTPEDMYVYPPLYIIMTLCMYSSLCVCMCIIMRAPIIIMYVMIPHIVYWKYSKALCHAISADCLLIKAVSCTHTVNEHWAWRMADKFAYTFKAARWGSLCWGVRLSRHRVDSQSYTYQYSYSLVVHNHRLPASTRPLQTSSTLHAFDPRVLSWTIPWYWASPYFLCPHFWTNEFIKKQLRLIYGHDLFNVM